MKKTVILITDIFPYKPGEEFLEHEITYWEMSVNINLIIMPKNKTKNIRKISDKISIDNTLEKVSFSKWKYISILFNSVFYKELFTQVVLSPNRIKDTLISCHNYLTYKKVLKKYLNNNKDKDILFYTYWHTEVTYALQSLKEEFSNIQIVTRTHGYDLYQERRNDKYMPLKRQFLNNIDKIYTITDIAVEYLTNIYGFGNSIIETSRLGVPDLNITSHATDKNTLHIVSCSSLVAVKRIEKIIDALNLLDEQKYYTKIVWTHIGDGPLRTKLEKYACEILKNVDYDFIGSVDNKDIFQFYHHNMVDVFINVSESEGVPVTIMEAMSCHIPIIAPDIGGISEMILDGYNGVLLSKKFMAKDVVEALIKSEFFKKYSTRQNSYSLYKEKYNAEENYSSFINKVIGL